ncbi:MAG: hypothetical protein V4578_11195 [Pseudomonadota bacterium]
MAIALLTHTAGAATPTAEFYHRGGAEGELKALDAVADALARQGAKLETHGANDDTENSIKVQQAGGDAALALKMHGQDLVRLAAQLGTLADVGRFKGAALWKAALPGDLLPFMADGKQLHGVPIGMHRANSVWASKAAFDKAGGGRCQPAGRNSMLPPASSRRLASRRWRWEGRPGRRATCSRTSCRVSAALNSIVRLWFGTIYTRWTARPCARSSSKCAC